ncbi:MAG: PAS domain-containing protein, partial [Nitrospiraceae bacterium]|nr:PAS domain-containing protein [Nitrospiraceae bacterium]
MKAGRSAVSGKTDGRAVFSYAISALAVLAGALVILVGPDLLPHLPPVTRDILGPVMLMAIAAPVLYYVSFRPLDRHIHELKRSGHELSRQNDFLKSAIESIPSPFCVIDAVDYTIKTANKAAVPGELREGLTCYAVSHRASQPCNSKDHPCPLEEVKKTGKPAVFEHVHYDEHGKARCYEVHGYPVMDSRVGKVAQMIEYSVDITDRKDSENRLRESEEMVKDFLDSANDLIQSVSPDGRFRYVNRAWRAALGYSREEL